MAEIVWTAQAAECLDQVFGWIEKDNREAAVGVVTGIYSKVQLLKNQPRIGSRYLGIEDREVREILYGHYRIPYLIRSEELIEILGVFHSAMRIEEYLK